MIPYTMPEVLRLNGINFNTSQKNIRISCPFCSSKKVNKNLGIDLDSEKFNCFSCGVSGRSATAFHAYLNNLSTKDAYSEIMAQLGYNENDKHDFPKRERQVTGIEPPLSQSKEAPDNIKSQVYETMLSQLKLSKRHLDDLLSRGFSEAEIQNLGYVSYPAALDEGITAEYFSIPKNIINKGLEVKGVPGFYKTKNTGTWALPKRKGGIIVCYRNFYNEITGIQIRKNDEDIKVDEETGEKENKYAWLSSNNLKDGCKVSTKIHYSTDFEWNKESKRFQPVLKNGTIVLTEGAMKGDLTHAITGMPLITIPGVSCAYDALKKNIPLLKSIGLKRIVIALDMDKVMNVNVLEALEKLKEIITSFEVEASDLYWSNEIVNTDGSHEKMDTASTFVFTAESLNNTLENKKLNKLLERVKNLKRANILFALSGSKELTEENKNNYALLKSACDKQRMSCKPVFWRLRLKGIDDYYACNQRNVNYILKK